MAVLVRLGPVKTEGRAAVEATATVENAAPLRFDGLVLPDGAAGVKRLGTCVEVMDFLSNQHRHGKTILALGAAKALLKQAGIEATLPDGRPDPGILVTAAANDPSAVAGFTAALGKNRHPEREAAAAVPR
jgi:catalase